MAMVLVLLSRSGRYVGGLVLFLAQHRNRSPSSHPAGEVGEFTP